MGNETSTETNDTGQHSVDKLFKLDGFAKASTSFFGCGNMAECPGGQPPSGSAAIPTSRVQARQVFRTSPTAPKAPTTWHPPSAAPGTTMPLDRKKEVLSCNESNVLPQRSMLNRFTAVGGHSEDRISMNSELESSEFQLALVHGPYEKVHVPENLRVSAEWSRDPEAQFELGALLVRAHVQQNEKYAVQQEFEQEMMGTTTPSSTPRGDRDSPARLESNKQLQSPALYEALKLFNCSSRRGNVQAQYTLGLCYATGVGLGREDARGAFPWLLLAAQQNVFMAQWRVGIVLFHAIDIEKDESKGVRWLQRAAAGGCGHAMADLAVIYLQDGHIQEAKQMAQDAENSGVHLKSERNRHFHMSVLHDELARQVIDIDSFKSRSSSGVDMNLW